MSQVIKDLQLVRAYQRIASARLNPVSGAKFGKSLKVKILKAFDALLDLQSFKEYSYESKKYHTRIHVAYGDIRISWEGIRAHVQDRTGEGLSLKTLQRYSHILASLEILTVEFDRLKGRKSSEVMKALVELEKNSGFRGLKVIHVDFPPEAIITTPEIDESILAQVTKILTEPMNQAFAEQLSEETIADIEPILNTLPTSKVENEKICRTVDRDLSLSPISPCGREYCASNSGTGCEWQVEAAIGGVGVRRVTIPRSEIPESIDGEFYASWIGEQNGIFYTPWIIWDIDAESEHFTDVLKARDRAWKLVQKLRSKGVPDSALRIVFSTRRGFHVYLDSRVVGLRPSKQLHAEIKAFCASLAKCDESLYSLRHIIGIPNSLHRVTKLYYVSVDLKSFQNASYPELRCLTVAPREFVPLAEVQAVIPELAKLFSAQTAKKATGIPEVLRRAQEPVPEYFGVEQGRRDRAVHYLCSYYRRLGLTEPEVFDLVSAANTRNNPPLPVDVVREKVRSAFVTKLRKELTTVPF